MVLYSVTRCWFLVILYSYMLLVSGGTVQCYMFLVSGGTVQCYMLLVSGGTVQLHAAGF